MKRFHIIKPSGIKGRDVVDFAGPRFDTAVAGWWNRESDGRKDGKSNRGQRLNPLVSELQLPQADPAGQMV
jgi:hypothetical protein